MKKFVFAVSLFAIAVFCLHQSAYAGEPRLVLKDGNWATYNFIENGQKVCYMVSKPIKDQGNYTKRGEIFTFLTNNPAQGTKNVFSYIAGYTYKAGSDASVEIDGKRFVLFTQDGHAWAPDAKTDEALASAIRKGSKMVVKGTSSRGTLTTDTFSLKGSGSVHERISKDCGS